MPVERIPATNEKVNILELVMKRFTVELSEDDITNPSADIETTTVYADSMGKAFDYIMRTNPWATVLSITLVEY